MVINFKTAKMWSRANVFNAIEAYLPHSSEFIGLK